MTKSNLLEIELDFFILEEYFDGIVSKHANNNVSKGVPHEQCQNARKQVNHAHRR